MDIKREQQSIRTDSKSLAHEEMMVELAAYTNDRTEYPCILNRDDALIRVGEGDERL